MRPAEITDPSDVYFRDNNVRPTPRSDVQSRTEAVLVTASVQTDSNEHNMHSTGRINNETSSSNSCPQITPTSSTPFTIPTAYSEFQPVKAGPEIERLNQQIASAETATIRPSEQEIAEILSGLTLDGIKRAIEAAEKMPESSQQNIDLIETSSAIFPISFKPGDSRPHVTLKINGVPSQPLLDSGAMTCLIGYREVDELAKYKTYVEPCSTTISTVTSGSSKVTGFMMLQYVIGKRSHVIPTVVIQSHRSYEIVGIDFWRAFDLKIGWDEAEITSLITPWNEEYTPRAENLGASATQQHNFEVNNHTEHKPLPSQRTAVEYADGTVGMLPVAHRISATFRKRMANMMPKLPLNTTFKGRLRKPIITSYETVEETYPSGNLNESDTKRTEGVDASPAQLIRKLLRERPRSAFEIHEVAIVAEIRTAAGGMYTAKLAPLRKEVIVKGLAEGAADIYVVTDRCGKELGRFHANQLYVR